MSRQARVGLDDWSRGIDAIAVEGVLSVLIMIAALTVGKRKRHAEWRPDIIANSV